MTSHLLENQLLQGNATCKTVMTQCWILVFELSQIISANDTHEGLISITVTLFAMNFKAVKRYSNLLRLYRAFSLDVTSKIGGVKIIAIMP